MILCVDQNSRKCAEIVFMARRDEKIMCKSSVKMARFCKSICSINSREWAEYLLKKCIRKQQSNVLKTVYGQVNVYGQLNT